MARLRLVRPVPPSGSDRGEWLEDLGERLTTGRSKDDLLDAVRSSHDLGECSKISGAILAS